MKPRLYLAGPYRAAYADLVELNVAKHRAAAGELTQMGFAVWSPILNSHSIADRVSEEEHLSNDLAWLPYAQLLVLLPGWERSEGSLKEKAKAGQYGIPVYVWPNERGELLQFLSRWKGEE
jgi:hypothetical protein